MRIHAGVEETGRRSRKALSPLDAHAMEGGARWLQLATVSIPQSAFRFQSGGATMSLRRAAPPGFKWVFVPRFWHWRKREYLYASDYGYSAWAFLVRA